jgi:hypothetical protein
MLYDPTVLFDLGFMPDQITTIHEILDFYFIAIGRYYAVNYLRDYRLINHPHEFRPKHFRQFQKQYEADCLKHLHINRPSNDFLPHSPFYALQCTRAFLAIHQLNQKYPRCYWADNHFLLKSQEFITQKTNPLEKIIDQWLQLKKSFILSHDDDAKLDHQ